MVNMLKFFDLVDENEKHHPLLFDKSNGKEQRCYSYSYKIDV